MRKYGVMRGAAIVPEQQRTYRELEATIDSTSIELVLGSCGSDVLALEHIMGLKGIGG